MMCVNTLTSIELQNVSTHTCVASRLNSRVLLEMESEGRNMSLVAFCVTDL